MFTESDPEIAEESRMHPIDEVIRRWCVAWIGTVVAGGVFGTVVGSVMGLLIGPFIAAFYGVPVICSVAVLSWALWLNRAIVLMAAIAGGLTGFIATAILWDPIFMLRYGQSLVAASIIGALGAGFCTARGEIRHGHCLGTNTARAGAWQYSLGDLFWRFTVVSLVIAFWATAVSKYFSRLHSIWQ